LLLLRTFAYSHTRYLVTKCSIMGLVAPQACPST